jgi:hypothetical protein
MGGKIDRNYWNQMVRDINEVITGPLACRVVQPLEEIPAGIQSTKYKTNKRGEEVAYTVVEGEQKITKGLIETVRAKLLEMCPTKVFIQPLTKLTTALFDELRNSGWCCGCCPSDCGSIRVYTAPGIACLYGDCQVANWPEYGEVQDIIHNLQVHPNPAPSNLFWYLVQTIVAGSEETNVTISSGQVESDGTIHAPFTSRIYKSFCASTSICNWFVKDCQCVSWESSIQQIYYTVHIYCSVYDEHCL